MTYQIEILNEVFYEIDDAILYYEELVLGLGKRFYKELQETIRIISLSPFTYQIKRKNHRQVKMKKFPFYIAYTIEKEGIIVNRLFHVRRNPKYRFK